MLKVDTTEQLAFFKKFVQELSDADDSDCDDDCVCDFQYRLGWAWDALADFAETMGSDFVKVANAGAFAVGQEIEGDNRSDVARDDTESS